MDVNFGCGRCVTHLVGPDHVQPDTLLICSTCGESDTFENVERIISEFVEHNAALEMHDLLKGVVSGNGNGSPPPDRVFRFILIYAS
jgi:hypothetical protein